MSSCGISGSQVPPRGVGVVFTVEGATHLPLLQTFVAPQESIVSGSQVAPIAVEAGGVGVEAGVAIQVLSLGCRCLGYKY